jgi:hypothetical protein
VGAGPAGFKPVVPGSDGSKVMGSGGVEDGDEVRAMELFLAVEHEIAAVSIHVVPVGIILGRDCYTNGRICH